jgi:hypothetical protein
LSEPPAVAGGPAKVKSKGKSEDGWFFKTLAFLLLLFYFCLSAAARQLPQAD